VQYCVVRAALDGRIVFGHFEGDAFRDSTVRALLARTQAAPHLPGQFARDNNNGAEVKITLTDGRVFTAKVDRALGRTTENPIPLDRLKAKFEDCARRVLTPDAAKAAVRAIDGFENIQSIREFTAMLEPAAGPVAARQSKRSKA
jgi:2-methylcitrate dehydratase PrpD